MFTRIIEYNLESDNQSPTAADEQTFYLHLHDCHDIIHDTDAKLLPLDNNRKQCIEQTALQWLQAGSIIMTGCCSEYENGIKVAY